MARWPTFLVIGAAKSGTTSLYHYLAQHPQIFMSPVKEPNYFAFANKPPLLNGPGDTEFTHSTTVTSTARYQKLFDDAPEIHVCGEASPSSLYYPQASDRIADVIPDARIIAILRDPVERAFSNFVMMIMQCREPLQNFSDAIAQESARLTSGWSYFWAYTGLGFYYEQLARYYRRFPARQIHVCLLEDLSQSPQPTVSKLYEFIGVDPSFHPDTSTKHHQSGTPESEWLHWFTDKTGLERTLRRLCPPPLIQALSSSLRPVIDRVRDWQQVAVQRNLNRPKISRADGEKLRDLYHDDILRLQALIDRDLSHWLQHDN